MLVLVRLIVPSKEMIYILYAKLPSEISDRQYLKYRGMVPPSLRGEHLKFRRLGDRLRNMVSKILLCKCIEKIGVDASSVNALKYNRHNRPYIDENLDFNISHSGNYVICAIGRNVQLGVDIEEIKPVNFEDFIPVMTADEWTFIRQAPHPLREFYRYWTMKESVFKANGFGINNDFHAVTFDRDFACLRDEKWYLTQLEIATNYTAHLACSTYTPLLNIEHVVI